MAPSARVSSRAEARGYQERTKHSFESVRAAARRLDWASKPEPLKRYAAADAVRLPDALPRPDIAALDALAARHGGEAAALSFPHLARILRWGAGTLRARPLPGEQGHHFRTYASAGALYPLELYVACGDLAGLRAGLYHFAPDELSLRLLHAGDVRGAIAAAAADDRTAEAAAILIVTGILWRSAWKYDARAYRHLWWDAGTMSANLLALASAAEIEAKLLTSFVDAELGSLLGLDKASEVPLALIRLGRAARAGDARAGEAMELHPASRLLPGRRFADADALHAASSLTTAEQVDAYRSAARRLGPLPGVAPHLPPAAAAPPAMDHDPLETVIRRRGSARDFAADPVPIEELATMLDAAGAPVAADVPRLCELYVVAHAIEGLEPGVYRHAGERGLDQVRRGDLRDATGFACLEQPHAAHAAAVTFLMAHLDRILAALGDRGYRAAQLDAGIRAGRLYLAAYAQGLGATGLTFYDDEVAELVGRPDLEPMMCVALGVDARRPDLRRVRERIRERGAAFG